MRRPIGVVPAGTLWIGLALPPDMNVGATLFGPRAAGPGLGDIQNSGIYKRKACC
jgi:hypothetical protein